MDLDGDRTLLPSGTDDAMAPEAPQQSQVDASAGQARTNASAHSPQPPESFRRTTTRGIGLAGGGYAIAQVLQFVAYFVLVRFLTPRDFGLYAAAALIAGVGTVFAESGMGAALITREDRVEAAASTAFFTLVVTGTGLTLGSLALSPVLGWAFHSSKVTAITAVLSGWLFLGAVGIVPDALLRRRFNFVRRTVLDPVSMLAYALTAIPLAVSGAGVWALVAGAYASIIVRTIGLWLVARFRPKPRLASVAMWRELASFARPLVVAETLRCVSLQIDTFMLGRFTGVAALGQYRNGMKIAQQPPTAFISVAAYVALPAFARISGSSERLANAARRGYSTTAVVLVPVSAACLPLGVPLAVVLMGDRWRLAGAVIAGLCGMILGNALLAIGIELMKAMAVLRLQVVAQILLLVLIAISVTITSLVWGPVGVAVALSLSTMAVALYAMVKISLALAIPAGRLCATLITPAIASAPMAIAMLAFQHGVDLLGQAEPVRVGLLVADIALGAAVYCAVLGLIDRSWREVGWRLLAWPVRGKSTRVDVSPLG